MTVPPAGTLRVWLRPSARDVASKVKLQEGWPLSMMHLWQAWTQPQLPCRSRGKDYEAMPEPSSASAATALGCTQTVSKHALMRPHPCCSYTRSGQATLRSA